MSVLAGIFVGGKSSRMGGRPKGLLPSPQGHEPLVVRSARLLSSLGLDIALIGDSEPYRSVLPNIAVVADVPPGIGPLGGLSGLLRAANGRAVLSLACDMPFVSSELLTRIVCEQPTAQVLAPRGQAGFWEPLCARYASSVLPVLDQALADQVRSFKALFARLHMHELPLSDGERAQLRDWDSPEDIDT